MENLQKIAMLIDADNTQLAKLEAVIQEVNTLGRIVVKRAYGNWKKDNLKRWESEIKRLAIKPEQQFDYVTGKNATDMAMVIDTIELLHQSIYDGFVLVASDSDYTPLAIHLREQGVYVGGVGEKKTPEAFRKSCDEFLYLENLGIPAPEAVPQPAKPSGKSGKGKKSKKQTAEDEAVARPRTSTRSTSCSARPGINTRTTTATPSSATRVSSSSAPSPTLTPAPTAIPSSPP